MFLGSRGKKLRVSRDARVTSSIHVSLKENSQKLGEFEVKRKLRGFLEDKNCNRMKVLIRKFHKKISESDTQKGKVYPQITIHGSLIRTPYLCYFLFT